MSLFNIDWNDNGKVDAGDSITDYFILDQILDDDEEDEDEEDL